MSGGHELLPPSSAHIWGAPNGCPGWVTMNLLYPETKEDEEAKEGTAAHEIGASMVVAHSRGGLGMPDRDKLIGTLASNGVLITDEMFDSAEVYANHVATVMRDSACFVPVVEQKIMISRVHQNNGGTPDCWLFVTAEGVLHIWDFKHGYEVVEAFENWQLIDYVAGILEKLGIPDDLIRVEFHIVQPRAYHREGPVRTWPVKGAELRGYFNTLEANAAEAMSGKPTYRSGPRNCKHCPGRHACDVARESGLQLYEVARRIMPHELPPHALGLQQAIIKRAIKQLQALETGYDAQIESLTRSGVDVPFWTTEPAYGREKWAKPAAEVIQLGDLCGVDLRKPDAVKTPNQARKLGIDTALIAAYSEKPRAGIKVVPDDTNKAKRAFTK